MSKRKISGDRGSVSQLYRAAVGWALPGGGQEKAAAGGASVRGGGPQQAPCRVLRLWAAASRLWHFSPVVLPRCFQTSPSRWKEGPHLCLMVSCSSLGPQVVIICLVILDALLVLAELILDLRIIQPDENNYAARVRCQQPYNSVHSRQPH